MIWKGGNIIQREKKITTDLRVSGASPAGFVLQSSHGGVGQNHYPFPKALALLSGWAEPFTGSAGSSHPALPISLGIH